MEYFVKFWGVRGSTPSPGPVTAAVGGNTSCVEVQLGGERLIMDGGTGLRGLGAQDAGRALSYTLLFSHMHWDHIQGVPFFLPLFHPESRVSICGPRGLRLALESQMSQPTFPVGMDMFRAKIEFVVLRPGQRFNVGDVEVSTCELNHPGGALGYRLSDGSASVAYICDHETVGAGPSRAVTELTSGADVLIADAQYTAVELPGKRGWGHSSYEQMTTLAREAGAGALFLTHHDPARTDGEVALIEGRSRLLFRRSQAAREGSVFLLEPEVARRGRERTSSRADDHEQWLEGGESRSGS